MTSGTRTRADLDQLAARDDHGRLAASAASHEEDGGGAVVDDEGRVRRRGRGQQRGGVASARAPSSGGEVELEIGVARGLVDGDRCRPRLVCRSTPVALTTGRRRAAAIS